MDSATAIGFVAALGAACCYETGYALQALEARRAPERLSLRVGLIRFLVRRKLWILGTALIGIGWPLQLLALSYAPLTLVQPTLALGLLLLLGLASRVLHEPVGKRELGGVVLIVAGVAGIALTAPKHTDAHAGGWALGLTLAGLGAAAAVPYALKLGGWALVCAAGAGDAWAAFALKLVSDELAGQRWLAALGFALGAALFAGLGFLAEMSALQLQRVTIVGPAVLSLQIVIPVVLAPLVGGEHWTNTALILFSLAVVCAGVVLLASSRTVVDVTQHE